MLGEELKKFVIDHESCNVQQLALQARKYPQIDMQEAIRQIAGRKIAKDKIPSWYQNQDIIYPLHLSMEQCSSEYTARYKANLCHGKKMVDLTGGLGVDFSFISRKFEQAIYIEQQDELVDIASHNFETLGYNNISTIKTDAVAYLQKNNEPIDLIYADPARRSSLGRKTVLIEDCTPNLLEIDSLLEQRAKWTMIKLSPMLDITLALESLKNISDVYIISYLNECKELLFIKKKEVKQTTILHSVNIKKDSIDEFSFTLEEEKSINLTHTSTLGRYLYEPNSSITKSGAYKSIARRYDLSKLHASSHLYTSDEFCTNFQGRKFEIIGISSLNKNDIKQHLADLEQANIATRNFPLSVAELRKRLKLKDGGNTYIFATTLADNQKVLILCHRL